MKRDPSVYPKGCSRDLVQDLIQRVERQTDEDAIAEADAALRLKHTHQAQAIKSTPMSNAKDLMKKLGGTGGGFLKPSAKPIIAATETEKKAGRPAGKHFDADQKGHNMKGKGPGAGASVPTSVRPKV